MSNTITNRFDSAYVRFLMGVVFPILIAALVIWMDYLEGPRTSFVGVISCVAFMAAIFSRPVQTAFVGVMTVFGCYVYGLTSEDAGTVRQFIRLCLIALACAAAVLYSTVRVRREEERQRLIEKRIELEAQSKLGQTDQLTGIANRHGVLEALATLDTWPRHVVLFDMDKLKEINDTFGHASGDECLKIVAQRLQRNLSSKDILGRWGGDEFVLIMPIHNRHAEKVVNRVIEKITAEPVNVDNNVLNPRISAGIAEWRSTQTFEESLMEADTALYLAKANGGNHAMIPWSI